MTVRLPSRALATLALVVSVSLPAAAQARRGAAADPYPTFAPRGFVMFSQQKFTAEQTFEAIFDDAVQPFRGFGADVALWRNFFAEFSYSRFEQDGERVFKNGDEIFKLGIPLTASLTPIEFSGGYRFMKWRRIAIPYAGAGFGSYHYEETSSFAAAGEDVDVTKNGYVLVGGVEVRLMRWVGVSVDGRHTSVTGIIGSGGLSQAFGEDDLGGNAFRVRILIGR